MTNVFFMQHSCITPQHRNTATPLVMLLMFLLSFSNAFAQNPDGDDYKVKIAEVFENLDKSPNRIKTGILFESGYNLIEQNRLNANAGAALDFTTWKTMYYSLQSAQVNNNSQLPTLDYVEGKIASNNDRTHVVLPIMRVAYNNVLNYAFDKGWLDIQNEQLFDTPDGLQNDPYEINTSFAVAPIYEESKTGNVTFSFNKLHYLTNTGLGIRFIRADFGDGAGIKTYQLGDKPSITYPNSGIKKLVFGVYFSDGSLLMSKSDFKVTVPEGNNLRYAYPNAPTVQTISAGGVSGKLYIAYSNPVTFQVKKPLIVLGGYDPLNEYGYRKFIDDIRREAYSSFDDALSDFGKYDLIFLDYDNGGASILQNSLLLEEALRIINLQKATDPITGLKEKNVVMGISMGGLVARYALNKIQKGQSSITTTHDTRLLITHDSPHQGANTAAGIQFMGRKIIGDAFLRTYVRPFSPVLQDLATFADAPAAREMLAYSTVSTSGNGVSFVANTFYNQFYIPNTTGVPTVSGNGENIFRFIATSQGDECGVGVVSPGGSLFASTGGAGASVLWGTFGANIGYEFYMNAANGNNRVLKFRLYNQVTLFSWFFGGVTITNNMRNYDINNPFPSLRLDSPAGGITPIGISFGFNVGFNIGLISFNASASATSSRGFSFVSRNSALDTNDPNYTGILVGAYTNVPAYGNASRANSFITQEKIFVTGAGLIAGNIVHTTFTYRQTQWLFEEMQREIPGRSQNCAQNCPYPVDAVGATINPAGATPNTSINGGGLYTGTSKSFNFTSSITLTDPAISYVWIIGGLSNGSSTSNVTFAGQGTSNVTINGLGDSTDPLLTYNYRVSVVIRTNCWQKTVSTIICSSGPKAIFPPNIGYTTNVAPTINSAIICAGGGEAVQITFRGAINIIINGFTVVVPTAGTVSPQGTIYDVDSFGTVRLKGYTNFTVYANNTCGPSPTYNFNIMRRPQAGCRLVAQTPKSAINFVVSPNPSTGNEITIAQEISRVQSTQETSASGEEQPQPQSEAKIEEFTLILYNKLQVKVRETTLNTLSKTISTEGLPNDVYFLHIIGKDGNKVVRQVMIMR